tara:strand:+ start:858 stop:998 length:141 start_codon:yes stop_codon:yes gene_type:complete
MKDVNEDIDIEESGDCDHAVEEAIEARNDEWASRQTEMDESGYGFY